jgi:hypothetical protein
MLWSSQTLPQVRGIHSPISQCAQREGIVTLRKADAGFVSDERTMIELRGFQPEGSVKQ